LPARDGGGAGLQAGRVAVGQAELEADIAGFAPVEGKREWLVAAAEAGVAVGGESHAVETPRVHPGRRGGFDADVVGATVVQPEVGEEAAVGHEGATRTVS